MKLMLTMAIIGLTVTALDGCNNQAGPKNGTTPTTTAAVATLQQQKLCADQADKSFKESAFSDGHSTFTDHFDPADGVCYMESESGPSRCVISLPTFQIGRTSASIGRGTNSVLCSLSCKRRTES